MLQVCCTVVLFYDQLVPSCCHSSFVVVSQSNLFNEQFTQQFIIVFRPICLVSFILEHASQEYAANLEHGNGTLTLYFEFMGVEIYLRALKNLFDTIVASIVLVFTAPHATANYATASRSGRYQGHVTAAGDNRWPGSATDMTRGQRLQAPSTTAGNGASSTAAMSRA